MSLIYLDCLTVCSCQQPLRNFIAVKKLYPRDRWQYVYLVGNHKDFCAVAMCCHPLEEMQDGYNLLFALITSAVLIPKCSAVSPTQPSLIYAAVGRYRNMVKIYIKKCTKTQGITIWHQYSWIELLPHFGLWISVRFIMHLDLYMLHENFLQKKSLTENHNKPW